MYTQDLKDNPTLLGKARFYLYEFFGTMIVVWSYNILSTFSAMLFAMTLVCWEVSCANFNNAITFGTLIFEKEDVK